MCHRVKEKCFEKLISNPTVKRNLAGSHAVVWSTRINRVIKWRSVKFSPVLISMLAHLHARLNALQSNVALRLFWRVLVHFTFSSSELQLKSVYKTEQHEEWKFWDFSLIWFGVFPQWKSLESYKLIPTFYFGGNFALCLKKNRVLFKRTVQILMTRACKIWRCCVDSGEFTWGLRCDSWLRMQTLVSE